jgi:hypothetical protein
VAETFPYDLHGGELFVDISGSTVSQCSVTISTTACQCTNTVTISTTVCQCTNTVTDSCLSSRVSPGGLAGIVIGCLVAGALIAFGFIAIR